MGRSGGSLSKRKHSKKKSLKISTEVGRKKKSRGTKSKKLRRHDDSFSSYSDDESSSSSMFSSSGSEGEYDKSKSKRSRSRVRSEVKGGKKRSRRRSLSEDSSSDSSPVKKRKRLTRKKSKKIKKKRKLRRDAYISSVSSDSESCSTCKDDGDSTSDEEGSHRRSRGRSREKKGHRGSIKGKTGNRKNRSRTRSSSLGNSYDDEIIENVTVENNSRRLKSVITVANLENEEGDNMRKDEFKEEIVYDYDDYPSSKSNDSNELVDRSNVSPEKGRTLTSVIGENTASSLNDSKEKEKNSSVNVESEVDNMEAILRQKALENLSRFRGIKPKTVVLPVEDKQKSVQTGVKQSTSASLDLGKSQRILPAPDQEQNMTPVSPPVIQRSRFTWRRDPSITTGKEEKVATGSESNPIGSLPAAPKLQSVNLSSTSRVLKQIVNEEKAATYSQSHSSGSLSSSSKLQNADLSYNKKVEHKIVNEEKAATYSRSHSSGSLRAAPKLESAGLSSKKLESNIVNEEKATTYSRSHSSGSLPAAPRLQSVGLSSTTREDNKIVNESSKTIADTNNSSGGTGTNVDQKSTTALEKPSSASSTKEGTSKEQQNETNDNSQFEKKTMSVMRGGEMVQVSYKVYIPTRAPALARRKLKR
uniref:E3 ubiquitin-protein ligase RBBP6 n=1 Tax=Erigeron canadensis TaxID=72917 RepID=UPI001CB9BACE|nr:E3 ubiquitin-protein ligase RBBP6 [Erigeron canadensis]